MIIGFEDAFMDAQSEIISLCLEFLDLTGQDADEIYAYAYQNEHETMFNAFFKKDGTILSAGKLGSDEQSDAFLHVGIESVIKLVAVCKKYEHKCPNECKLIYHVTSKQFDAKYEYTDCVAEKGISPVENLMKGKKEIERGTLS
mgnify:CR=1 FL=1